MEFRVIPGFEDYKVSDTGIVWNCLKNKELSQGGLCCIIYKCKGYENRGTL